MNNDKTKIAVAIGIGCVFGGVVARIVHPYIWWLGAIVGGLISYLQYEWRNVVTALHEAKKTMSWKFAYKYRKTRSQYRSPFFRNAFKANLYDWASMLSLCSTIWLAFVSFEILVLLSASQAIRPVVFERATNLGFVVSGVLAAVASISFLINLDRSLRDANDIVWSNLEYVNKEISRRKSIIWKVSPIFCSLQIIKAFYYVIAFFCVLIAVVFIKIHSQKRLICGVDSAIGTLAGYWLGHAMICALVGSAIGVVLGVINYELVSIRWLKLKPV